MLKKRIEVTLTRRRPGEQASCVTRFLRHQDCFDPNVAINIHTNRCHIQLVYMSVYALKLATQVSAAFAMIMSVRPSHS